MELELKRKWMTSQATCGELLVDGYFTAFTLELPIKDGRPGSAIPLGRYPIIITYSPKFERDMPLLLNIPGRSDIRIHWGNTEQDTEGCILVGHNHLQDTVGESRLAFNNLYPQIEGPAKAGDCWITLTEEPLIT